MMHVHYRRVVRPLIVVGYIRGVAVGRGDVCLLYLTRRSNGFVMTTDTWGPHYPTGANLWPAVRQRIEHGLQRPSVQRPDGRRLV